MPKQLSVKVSSNRKCAPQRFFINESIPIFCRLLEIVCILATLKQTDILCQNKDFDAINTEFVLGATIKNKLASAMGLYISNVIFKAQPIDQLSAYKKYFNDNKEWVKKIQQLCYEVAEFLYEINFIDQSLQLIKDHVQNHHQALYLYVKILIKKKHQQAQGIVKSKIQHMQENPQKYFEGGVSHKKKLQQLQVLIYCTSSQYKKLLKLFSQRQLKQFSCPDDLIQFLEKKFDSISDQQIAYLQKLKSPGYSSDRKCSSKSDYEDCPFACTFMDIIIDGKMYCSSCRLNDKQVIKLVQEKNKQIRREIQKLPAIIQEFKKSKIDYIFFQKQANQTQSNHQMSAYKKFYYNKHTNKSQIKQNWQLCYEVAEFLYEKRFYDQSLQFIKGQIQNRFEAFQLYVKILISQKKYSEALTIVEKRIKALKMNNKATKISELNPQQGVGQDKTEQTLQELLILINCYLKDYENLLRFCFKKNRKQFPLFNHLVEFLLIKYKGMDDKKEKKLSSFRSPGRKTRKICSSGLEKCKNQCTFVDVMIGKQIYCQNCCQKSEQVKKLIQNHDRITMQGIQKLPSVIQQFKKQKK